MYKTLTLNFVQNFLWHALVIEKLEKLKSMIKIYLCCFYDNNNMIYSGNFSLKQRKILVEILSKILIPLISLTPMQLTHGAHTFAVHTFS